VNTVPPDGSADQPDPVTEAYSPKGPLSAATSSAELGLFDRLKRHKVIEWTLAYAASAYTLLHVLEMLSEAQEWPRLIVRIASLALILGAPVASLLAWYHGAKGLKRISGPELAILTVLLFIAGSLLWHFGRERAAAAHEVAVGARAVPPAAPVPAASIAVLPFADMSEKRDQEYFADGMAEEVLNVLARVDGLKVASRSSSFQFRKRDDLGAPRMAAELGVRHLLEGSVRKSGGTVRITVQLIDADKDEHLWSETYDRPLTTKNLFAIQDEVAKAVVAALRTHLGTNVGNVAPVLARTDNVDAYGLFLKARALFQARRDFATAEQLLEEAIRLDPNFADALATRAAVYAIGEQYGPDVGNHQAALEKANLLAHQALTIDSQNSLAMAVIGILKFIDHAEGRNDKNYADSISDLERALSANPNESNAWAWLGVTQAYVGQVNRAIISHQRCVAVDPALTYCRVALIVDLLSAGRSAEANEVFDAAMADGVVAFHPSILIALAEMNRRDAFLLLMNAIGGVRGMRNVTAVYDAIRSPESDHRALAALLRRLLTENNASQANFMLLNAIGSYSQPLGTNGDVLWTRTMSPYRHSAEFRKHMRTGGVFDYWKAHGFPPQCHPIGNDDFKCD
jgi:adenylate cyclase